MVTGTEMKRKWTQNQIDFPWGAISDEHMAHLKRRFMVNDHGARENNLFRYLLGAHNRITELEAEKEASKPTAPWYTSYIELEKKLAKIYAVSESEVRGDIVSSDAAAQIQTILGIE